MVNTTPSPVATVGNTFLVNGAPLVPGSLSGLVFEDFNDDGQVDFGERGIGGVTITLTGTDDLGNAVSASQTTDADGTYLFGTLRPGSYRVAETQPAGYTQGTAAVNVGYLGFAFGVADNTVMTVLDLLRATNAQAVNGRPYNGDALKRLAAIGDTVSQSFNGSRVEQMVFAHYCFTRRKK